MSEHTETSGRPLASKLNEVQSTQGNLINTSSTTKANKQPKVSNDLPSSDGSPKPRTQRRGATSTVSSGPHAGSSRSVQKSAASLNKMSAQMSPVHYTKTGRVSKAKKGLKVHNCHCGRVSPAHPQIDNPPVGDFKYTLSPYYTME